MINRFRSLTLLFLVAVLMACSQAQVLAEPSRPAIQFVTSNPKPFMRPKVGPTRPLATPRSSTKPGKTNSTFTAIVDMNEARAGHTASLLPNGQVLITGGWGVDGRLATSELFDPETELFSSDASMSVPRAGMIVTLLPYGRVLFAGGNFDRDQPQLVAEIYDSKTGTLTESGSLHYGRLSQTATLLQDGAVLIFGGRPDNKGSILDSAEIYNPETGEFTLAGTPNRERHKHAAVLLEDGRVLILGGANDVDWDGHYSNAELYDPQDDTFQTVGEIGEDYFFATLTHLQDGRVLICGGYNDSIYPSSKAWIYDYR